MRGWLVVLTEFGDIAVLLPLAAIMLAWLLLMRSAQRGVVGCRCCLLCWRNRGSQDFLLRMSARARAA